MPYHENGRTRTDGRIATRKSVVLAAYAVHAQSYRSPRSRYARRLG